MAQELSDEEVFGASEMSDAEVFGELSDEDVFGAPPFQPPGAPLSLRLDSQLPGDVSAIAGGPPVAIAPGAGRQTFEDITEGAHRIWERANTPTIELATPLTPEEQQRIRETGTKGAQIGAGVYQAGSGLANYFTSPLGIATLGLGFIPRALARTVSAAFATHMASQTPELARELGSELGKPEGERDLQKVSELITSGAANTAFATLAGTHATRPTPARQKAVEALARQLEQGEMTAPTRPAEPIRELGLPRPTAEPFLQPGVPELASAALREGMSPIITPESGTAMRALRERVEPTQLEASTRAIKPEPLGGQISFAAPARAGSIPSARQASVSRESARPAPVEVPKAEPKAKPATARELIDAPPEEILSVSTEGAIAIGRQSRTPEQIRVLRDAEVRVQDEVRRATEAQDMEALIKVGHKKQIITETLDSALGFTVEQKTDPNFGFAAKRKAALDESVKPAEAPKPVETKPSDIANALASKLDNLKSGVDPKRGDLGTFNVIPKVWDAAIEVAQGIIRKGGTVADAIEAAIKHIRTNQKGQWFEREARRDLELALTESPAVRPQSRVELPASREVVPETGAAAGTTPEGSTRMRTLSARGTTSEKVPDPVQERIADAPESYYRQQSLSGVERAAKEKTDAELASVTKESDSYTADRLELVNRLFAENKTEQGYKVFQELSTDLTRMGQVINQAKLFQALLPENVVRVVNGRLKEAGRDVLTEKQAGELTELARGRIESTGKLNEATREWQSNPTDANAAKAEKLLKEANNAALREQKFVNQFQNRSTLDLMKAMLQGNLLTPISQVANLVGNVSFMPFRMHARWTAEAIDVVDAYLRNRPRQIASGSIKETAASAIGASKNIPRIFAEGSGGAIKGEMRAGMNPMKAWVRQFAKNPDLPTVKGRLTVQDRVNLLLEGTLGIPSEAMLRGLAAGDAPFKGAAYGRLISEQAKLQKIPASQMKMARLFPELFFDSKTLARIENEALSAVFQQKSPTMIHFASWLRGKGKLVDFLATTVIPYKLTPWNIVKEILSYNPLFALGRTAYEAKKGNTRSAEMSAGKFITGSALTLSAVWLYNKGLIAPSLDSKDEQQKARILAGEVLPPNHINVSGLKRALAGDDPTYRPGDTTMDTFRAGGLAGSVLYMVANIGRDLEKNPEGDDIATSIIRNSTLEQARFGLNQSFLKGVAGTLEAIQTGRTDNWLQSYFGGLMSIPLPNTLSVVSRAQRKYKVDINAEKTVDRLANVLKTRVGFSGLDDMLPLKRGLWGEPISETPEDTNAYLHHFLDITKSQQVTDDPVTLEIYRLWRQYANTGVIPQPPTKSLRVSFTNEEGSRVRKNFALTPAQQSSLAESIGKIRKAAMDRIVVNPNYHRLPDAERIEIIRSVYNAGSKAGRMRFLEENAKNLKEAPEKSGFDFGEPVLELTEELE